MMDEKFKLENQLCFRLYTASRLLTQVYNPMLSEFGITYPQYLTLMVLWEKDAMPVNDIAKRLMLETNTVTPLLKRMESSGLVTRSKGERDARQTIVTLTAKGAAMKNKMTCIPDKVGSAVICDSLTPETVPTLFRMLDDIILKLKP
ncbi:MAG: MarR family transcriptional regulator [Bacteroidales bacterium]|nr:MarR family transcriptional regulator [Bacteroidales bacterium]